jgi:hypothetical protein
MELKVMVAENGFVISETEGSHMMGKMWAFETPESLAKYMKEWGEKNMKPEKLKSEKKI